MKQRPKQRWPNRDYQQTSYQKLNAKASDDEESGDEETELFNIIQKRAPSTAKHKIRELPTIDKKVEEGDTLQSIAIRYHCTVAELKRINNIHRENEIFAKITLKVPIRPITMAGVHISGNSSPLLPSLIPVDPDTLTDKLETVSKQDTCEVNKTIFNSTMASSSNSNTNSLSVSSAVMEPIDEDISHPFINEQEVHLVPAEFQQRKKSTSEVVPSLSCSGADGDLSWLALISCVLILSFAGPLIYVFYIAEHPEKYLHNHDHDH